MMHKRYFTVVSFFLCALVLALAIRGLGGNPNADDLGTRRWKESGPFELSPERGRFALLYALVERHSVFLSPELARFAAPDAGLAPSGSYVSLFAPGVSFLLVPGYAIGKLFHAAQIGSVAVIALFALMNVALIRLIALRLGAHPLAAFVAGLSFLFATPAFTYAVSIYQHHISTFFILSGLYVLMRFRGWWPVAFVWFLYALSLSIDNPNAFLMAPVALLAVKRMLDIHPLGDRVEVSVKLAGLATMLVAAVPLAGFAWFNQISNGSPTRLSGTLHQVRGVDAEGRPFDPDPKRALTDVVEAAANTQDETASFFQSRNLLNGFFVHSVSPDRGALWYAPIALVGIAGIVMLYATEVSIANVLAGIVGVTVVLYSMWGDPYGGWAFGSRYLIPAYAMLCIGVGKVLTRIRSSVPALAAFALLFGYSSAINTLGAVTSSANPPQIEVLDLERIYGKEQKYSYDRNWQYLHEEGSKSFAFRAYAGRFLTAVEYYWIVVVLLWSVAAWYLFQLARKDSIDST